MLFVTVYDNFRFFFIHERTPLVNPVCNWLLLFNARRRVLGRSSTISIDVVCFISIYFRKTDFFPRSPNRKRIEFHSEKTPFSALNRKSRKRRRRANASSVHVHPAAVYARTFYFEYRVFFSFFYRLVANVIINTDSNNNNKLSVYVHARVYLRTSCLRFKFRVCSHGRICKRVRFVVRYRIIENIT